MLRINGFRHKACAAVQNDRGAVVHQTEGGGRVGDAVHADGADIDEREIQLRKVLRRKEMDLFPIACGHFFLQTRDDG